MSTAVTAAWLRDDLRRCFGLAGRRAGPPRVGAELELLALGVATGRPVPIVPTAEPGAATLPVLRAYGESRGWREEATAYGAPRFLLPDGAMVSFEPGGQVELSTAPQPGASALVDALTREIPPLQAAAARAGIELRPVGLDPVNGVEATPLQLTGTRYRRMDTFLRALGTGGERMMRQTAALQLNLDWGEDPLARWRVLNTAAPYLTALFATSTREAGVPSDAWCVRARVWRELGGGRTGIPGPGADPVAEYLDFALRAPAILLERAGPGFPPFGSVRDVTDDEWRTHLSTLFPEVRPRGWAELRALDAMPVEAAAAPIVLVTGLACDPAARRALLAELPFPGEETLRRAALAGLRDERIAAGAARVAELGLAGAARLGDRWARPEHRASAAAWLGDRLAPCRLPAAAVP